jgi:hypothetical protein
MEPTASGCKKLLAIAGFERRTLLNGARMNIKFSGIHKQTFVTFDPRAISPHARYIMSSGEIVSRHGKLFLIIKFQKSNIFKGIIHLFI